MTDARLKGEWLTAAAHDALSDQAYRVLHNALIHCAEQGTDGAIAERELRFLYPGTLDRRWLDELQRAGFIDRTPTGYQLRNWATTLGQSTAQQVKDYREANAARQAAWRPAKRPKTPKNPSEAEDPPRSEAVTDDVTSDVTRYVGRTGEAGQAKQASDESDIQDALENLSWETAQIPMDIPA